MFSSGRDRRKASTSACRAPARTRPHPLAALALIVGWAAATVAAESNRPGGAAGLLEEMVRRHLSFPPSASRVETRMDWKAREEQGSEFYVRDIRLDGARADVVEERYEVDDANQIPVGWNRFLWDGHQYLMKQDLADRTTGGRSYMVATSARREKSAALAAGPYSGGFLCGYLDGDTHIAEQLKTAASLTLASEMADVRGHACYVLSAVLGETYYQLWIDPQADFQMRQARVEPRGRAPTVLEDVEIKLIAGRWIPVSGTLTIKGDADHWQAFHSVRTGISLHPDFQKMKAFQLEGIPNGTEVLNMDFPGIAYVWHNGQIIPDAGDRYIDVLDRAIQDAQRSLQEELLTSPNVASSPLAPERPGELPDAPLADATEQPARSFRVHLGLWVAAAAMGILLACLVIPRLSRREES